MTDLAKGSLEDKTAIAHAIDLLTHYSFDLGDRTAAQLMEQWQQKYPAGWIRWAVIEALYQGRYKAVSADQILQLWLRRNQPCYHFSYEFERLVCHKFPRNLTLTQEGRKPLPPPPDAAVLPTLPAPAGPNREVEQTSAEPPAWVALAEQIQQDPSSESPPEASVEPEENASEVTRLGTAADLVTHSASVDALPMRSMARLQAGVEALIEEATSNLNASAEAMKTRLKVDDYQAGRNGVSEISTVPEEPYPPIHQFTPSINSPEFHTKLRSVVNQEPDDP